MTKAELTALYRAALCLVLVAVYLSLNACTFTRYTNPEHTLTVIDIHPMGETVALDAELTGKGRVTLNREQGGAEGLVEQAGRAINPFPLL